MNAQIQGYEPARVINHWTERTDSDLVELSIQGRRGSLYRRMWRHLDAEIVRGWESCERTIEHLQLCGVDSPRDNALYVYASDPALRWAMTQPSPGCYFHGPRNEVDKFWKSICRQETQKELHAALSRILWTSARDALAERDRQETPGRVAQHHDVVACRGPLGGPPTREEFWAAIERVGGSAEFFCELGERILQYAS